MGKYYATHWQCDVCDSRLVKTRLGFLLCRACNAYKGKEVEAEANGLKKDFRESRWRW